MNVISWQRLLGVSCGLVLLGAAGPGLRAESMVVNWQVPDEDARFTANGYSPLPNVSTETVYDVTQPTDGIYNHHPAIATLGDGLVATWSNHLQGHTTGGEEGPGQKVMCRHASDGQNWSAAGDLFPSLDDHGDAFDAGRVVIANGFARVNGNLYAIGETSDNEAKESGESRQRTGLGRLARKINPDGSLGNVFWLDSDPPAPKAGYPQVPDPGSDPSLASTASAIRNYLDQPLNQPAWDYIARNNNTEPTGDGKRLVEPSTYQRPGGSLVRLFRDTGNRGFLYARESNDGGQSWSTPTQTNVPDSPSKTISGTLPDGRTYMIGNQVNDKAYERDPLTLAISRDGVNYDWAAAIRFDRPGIEFPGDGKGPGYQYPAATVDGNELVVTYSIGKEDIAVSRFAIPQFADAPKGSQLLVASAHGQRITRFDGPTGRFVDHFSADAKTNALNTPVALTLGPDGMLYVANRGNNQVLRYNPNSGEMLGVFVDGQGLDAPAGLAFTPAGDLLVSNRHGNNVLRFAGPSASTPGQDKGALVSAGDGGLDGAFNMVQRNGDLFVSSFDNDKVLRYDAQSGDFKNVFAEGNPLVRPQGLLFEDNGNLLVVSSGSNDVLRYGPDGSLLGTFVDGEGRLNSPNDLAFGPDGDLYVSSRLDQQVLRFDGQTGKFKSVFAYGAAMQTTTGIVFTPIPEPASLSLIGLGLIGLMGRPRR